MKVLILAADDGSPVGHIWDTPEGIEFRPWPGADEHANRVHAEVLDDITDDFTDQHESGEHFLRELAAKYPRTVKVVPNVAQR